MGGDAGPALQRGASTTTKANARSGGAAGAALSAQLGLEGGQVPTGEELDRLIDEQANIADGSDEPTLAQRLKSMQVESRSNKKVAAIEDDSSDSEEDDAPVGKRATIAPGSGGSTSLAQALTQALHSGDSALLTSCLIHGDPSLIRGTVARLSGPLAVRLLENCIERMGQGNTSKGALGSQRAKSLIEWVRVTLIIHMGYFMSLPHLVTRLFHLHSALMARLASQEKLLELHGRLELVLAQIELRATYAAEAAAVQGVRGNLSKRRSSKAPSQGTVWVESDGEEEMDVDGDALADDVESGEEDGEVQDIALGVRGGDSEEDESSEEDEAMEVNELEDSASVSSEGEGDVAGSDDEEEEYDEDADEAGSLEDFVVDDDEEDFDGDSDAVSSDEDESEEEAPVKAKRQQRSALVDDEAEETSDEGTGPDDDDSE